MECRETGYRDEPEQPEDELLIDAAIDEAKAFIPFMLSGQAFPKGPRKAAIGTNPYRLAVIGNGLFVRTRRKA